MQNNVTRRDAIRQLAAVPAAGLLAGTVGGAPARAAGGGWGPGPRSGMPFWLGCANGDYDSLVGLMPPGRSLDVANQWETEGPYLDVAVRNTTGWHNQRPHAFLAAGAAVQWNSSPFCSGSTMVVPDAWPARPAAVTSGLPPQLLGPPTFTGAETRASGPRSSAGSGGSPPTAGWSRSGARRC